MKSKRTTLPNWLAGVCFLLSMGGCGGGGGDDNPPASLTYSGNNNPASIDTTSAAKIASDYFVSEESLGLVTSLDGSSNGSATLLGAARQTIAIGLALSPANSGMKQALSTLSRPTAVESIDETEPCDNGGSMRFTGSIDNVTYLGSVNIQMTNCTMGDLVSNGLMVMRIDAYDFAYDTFSDATITYGNLVMTGPFGAMTQSGTIRMQTSAAARRLTMTSNMVSRDDVRSTMAKVENLIVVVTYNNFLTPSNYTSSIQGRLYDSQQGYVDIATPVSLSYSTLSQAYPNSGQLRFTGVSNSRMLVDAQSSTKLQLRLDQDGNGVYESTSYLNWSDLGQAISADLGDTDADGIPNSWETAHGLNPQDGLDAGLDTDSDGFTNYQEYVAGRNPSIPG